MKRERTIRTVLRSALIAAVVVLAAGAVVFLMDLPESRGLWTGIALLLFFQGGVAVGAALVQEEAPAPVDDLGATTPKEVSPWQ